MLNNQVQLKFTMVDKWVCVSVQYVYMLNLHQLATILCSQLSVVVMFVISHCWSAAVYKLMF